MIERSYERHSVSPVLKELEDSIEFISFESHVNIVDKVIQDFENNKEINCYYPLSNLHINYVGEGRIDNSETFMLRLLTERLKDMGIEKSVNVHSTPRELIENRVTEVVLIDDAAYTAFQKKNDLKNIPHNVSVHLFFAGITQKAIDRIEDILKRNTPESSLTYSQLVRPLGDLLSERAKTLFSEKDLSKPLVFTPFKNPDFWSQAQCPDMNLVPFEPGGSTAYIDPKFLLDTDKFSGYTKTS